MLPFKFDLRNVEDRKIKIEDITIRLIKTKDSDYIDSIEVDYPTWLDDDLIPKDEYDVFKLYEFENKVIKKVGVKVSKFVNAYYRQVENHLINQIFNGDSFTTYYESYILGNDGKIIGSLVNGNCGVRVVEKELYERIIKDINNKNLNIVDEFMRIVGAFIENGYFEMAIINLSMALEAFIKSLVFSKGLKVQDLDGKGYLDKFFVSGLKKSIGLSINEIDPDYYDAISLITKARNQVAHGSSLYDIVEFKQLSEDEIYDYIQDLIFTVEEIFEAINVRWH